MRYPRCSLSYCKQRKEARQENVNSRRRQGLSPSGCFLSETGSYHCPSKVYLDIIYPSVLPFLVLPQTCRDYLSMPSRLFSAACELPFPQILRNDNHTD